MVKGKHIVLNSLKNTTTQLKAWCKKTNKSELLCRWVITGEKFASSQYQGHKKPLHRDKESKQIKSDNQYGETRKRSELEWNETDSSGPWQTEVWRKRKCLILRLISAYPRFQEKTWQTAAFSRLSCRNSILKLLSRNHWVSECAS